MNIAEEIAALVARGNTDKAVSTIEQQMRVTPENEQLYLLLGKVYQQSGNWARAMECYMDARTINPEGPASEMLQMASEVMNFYNKDIYNP